MIKQDNEMIRLVLWTWSVALICIGCAPLIAKCIMM